MSANSAFGSPTSSGGRGQHPVVVPRPKKSLDRLAAKEGPMDEGDLALIEPHLGSIAFAAAEFSRPEGSEDHCKILLHELQEAVAARLG